MQMKCEFPNGEFEFSSQINNREVHPVLATNDPHVSSPLPNAIYGAPHNGSTAQPVPVSAPASKPQPSTPALRRRRHSRFNGKVANTLCAKRIEVAMYHFGLHTAGSAATQCGVKTSAIVRAVSYPGGWSALSPPVQGRIADGLGLPRDFTIHKNNNHLPAWLADAENRLNNSKRTETTTGVPFIKTLLACCLAEAIARNGGHMSDIARRLSLSESTLKDAMTRSTSGLALDAPRIGILAKLSGWPLADVQAAVNNDVATSVSVSAAPETRQRAVVQVPAHAPTPPESPTPATSPSPTPAPRTPQPADPSITRAAAEPNMDLALAKRAVAWLYATTTNPLVRDDAGSLLLALMPGTAGPA
ncbi:MAG TPA: hypothetical protein VF292_03020 [Rhodanobacteraceae bacterium]